MLDGDKLVTQSLVKVIRLSPEQLQCELSFALSGKAYYRKRKLKLRTYALSKTWMMQLGYNCGEAVVGWGCDEDIAELQKLPMWGKQ